MKREAMKILPRASRLINKIMSSFRTIITTLTHPRTDWLLMDKAEFHAMHEVEHLKKLLTFLNVDCVFDVGANEGQYAEMLRKKVGFGGIIISFEPNPDAASILIKKAKYDDSWYVEQLALSETNGYLEFNIMQGSQFSSLSSPRTDETNLFNEKNNVEKVSQVRSEILESAYDRLQKALQFGRPFLKMDSQGYDTKIFLSGGNRLSRFCGLQSELSFKRIYEDSALYSGAIRFYEDAGYHLSALVPNNRGHFPDLIEMDCIMYRSDN